MVDLLVLCCFLELVRLAHARPQHIPLAAVGRHDTHSSSLHCVDHGVVDVGGVVHLEA